MDFQRVRQFGKSYAHPLVVLVVLPNELDRVRVGVTAGRSVGNAVKRNRAKRIIRAAVSPFLDAIEPGWDLVLIARKPILKVKSTELSDVIHLLLKKSKLLDNENR